MAQQFDKQFFCGLSADYFRHPLDRQATQTLKILPGLDLLVRTLIGPTAEQIFYLDNIASSLQVSRQQLPNLYKLHAEACQILDIDIPDLYVRQNPVPNAYTMAIRGKRPFVVVHSSLLDLLEPEEIQAVIGHELGHLKCDHGVYLTLANLMLLGAQLLPGLEVVAQPLRDRLMEWVRCAEFTCDRAALLVSQDSRVVASVLMKLAGGSPKLASQLNLDAFLAQAQSYDEISQTDLGQVIRQMQTAPLTHPLPVLRAREIDRWGQSETYQTLLRGDAKSYTIPGGSGNKSELVQRQPLDSQKFKGEWRNW
jgi:Zn-dependent protease with chaperone function